MLRNSQDNPSVPFTGAMHLPKDYFISIYVLQNIKRPNNVKFPFKRYQSGIHLNKIYLGG